MLNHFITPPQPTPQPLTPAAPPAIVQDDGRKKREQCFIIMRQFKNRLAQNGITENAFWCWALATRELPFTGSRSQLSALDWTILAARLQTAQQNPHMFNVLCKTIHKQADCRVYRINTDLTETQIHTGVFDKSVFERCQRHADRTGCVVRCHMFGERQMFEPKRLKPDPTAPPTIENDPAKPARVYEVHHTGRETKWVEIPFPDTPNLRVWAQAYADKQNVDIEISTRDKCVLMRFSPTATY